MYQIDLSHHPLQIDRARVKFKSHVAGIFYVGSWLALNENRCFVRFIRTRWYSEAIGRQHARKFVIATVHGRTEVSYVMGNLLLVLFGNIDGYRQFVTNQWPDLG